MKKTARMALVTTSIVVATVGATASPAAAHVHTVDAGAAEATLAHGQLHGLFTLAGGAYVSCGGDAAAYGLESAHHGPDAGTPGRAEGCYETTDGESPGQDVTNPVIR